MYIHLNSLHMRMQTPQPCPSHLTDLAQSHAQLQNKQSTNNLRRTISIYTSVHLIINSLHVRDIHIVSRGTDIFILLSSKDVHAHHMYLFNISL